MYFGLRVFQHEQQQHQRQVKERVYKERLDPRQSMSDAEFKGHFHFTKESVNRLTELLREDISFETNRGLPVPPFQQVCIALNHYSGGHFQRISGWCAGVSQNAARLSLVRVTEALIRKKQQFIFMLSVDQMQDTSERMLEKFKLPRFAMSVDGVQVRFGKHQVKFQQIRPSRCTGVENSVIVNVQVVGNDKFMYDLNVGWPGSTQDARLWNRSKVKRHVERQCSFCV